MQGDEGILQSCAFGIVYHACILAYVFFQFSNDSKQTQIYISIFSSPHFDSDPVWRLHGLLPVISLWDIYCSELTNGHVIFLATVI